MRETIKEWKDEWIETNGKTDELEEKKVVNSAKIIDSTVPDRIGAYSLKI